MKKITLLTLVLSMWTGISYANGYVKPPVNFHQYKVTHTRAAALPSSYDARKDGIVQPVRNQLVDGTCWAFSTCDALQTLYLKNGMETGYLSPQVLATCFKGFSIRPIKDGGNSLIAGSMFARLEGIVLESAVPYNPSNTDCASYTEQNIPAYTLGWEFLPENDAIAIKEAILKYGSVTCSYYHHEDYFDPATYLYEYTGSNVSNHGVSIIGWDDAKQAWLIKNTWGNHRFDEGCIWVSYKDTNIATECTVYTDITPTNKVDHVYQYSTTGMVGNYGSNNANQRINGVARHTFGANEQLTYIGTYNIIEGTKVVFFVKDTKGNLLYESEEVVLPLTGFYKHTLKEPLPVSGEVDICVGYESDTYARVIPIEIESEGYNTVTLHPNSQWVYFEGSTNKTALSTTNNPYNLCIYAYTQDRKETAVENTYANKRVYNGHCINHEVWNHAASITLYNIVGKEVATLPVGETQLPALMSGIYIIKVTWQDGSSYAEKVCMP